MTAAFLSGLLKIAAVAVVTAGIGGGVYLVAERGTADDRQGAPTTLQEPLSPPNQIDNDPQFPPDRVNAPTPTPPASVTTSPQALDTSGWLTYSSPLGFTIKYPTDWIATDADPSKGLLPGNARIVMQHPPGTGDIVVDAGNVSIPPGVSHAWLEIIPDLSRRFVPEEIFQICGPSPSEAEDQGFSISVRETTLAGQRAVVCVQQARSRDGEHIFRLESYWVQLPGSGVVILRSEVVDPNSLTFATVQAFPDTVAFE